MKWLDKLFHSWDCERHDVSFHHYGAQVKIVTDPGKKYESVSAANFKSELKGLLWTITALIKTCECLEKSVQ